MTVVCMLYVQCSGVDVKVFRVFSTPMSMQNSHTWLHYSGWLSVSCSCAETKTWTTRMWANAQRDDRPSEYRWCPLLNATKFGWRPLLECHAVTLPKLEIRWNLLGCRKLTKRSQPLGGRSSPCCKDMCGRCFCLTGFFSDSIRALVAKIQPGKVVRWCPDGDFLGPPFPASHAQHMSDLHSKCALGPHRV